MKSRVLENIHGLASDECPENCRSLLDQIISETGFTEEKIRYRSREILKSILHNYASFDISTIDRFTHKVLRTFARDLGLPTNFEVELNNLQILKEAIDKLLNRAGIDKDLTKVLINFTLSKTDDDKSWDITGNLLDIAKLITNENNQYQLQKLRKKTLQDFSEFSKALNKKIKLLETQIPESATNFFNLIKERARHLECVLFLSIDGVIHPAHVGIGNRALELA